MAKRLNPNLAKLRRSYTIREAADLFGVHKNTVREWIKAGLPVIDDQKPFLILGSELRAFLRQRNAARKYKCKPEEMYCVKCKKPQKPGANMVDFQPTTESTGAMVAVCPQCTIIMHKFISLSIWQEIRHKFDSRWRERKND